MRVGFGYDAHVLVTGRDLYLGGVQLPHESGLLGHSDGDVVLHAISDAILGAAGLEDIGLLFPNTDKSIEGIDSAKILAMAADAAREKGYEIVNIDCVIICESPKITPYRLQIRERIASIAGLSADRVNIKGKTTEGMGFAGRREGIESQAVCLLEEAKR
jgi:2-C-methyl-D-erythritol 2,4-cyclodiphosphate synthase